MTKVKAAVPSIYLMAALVAVLVIAIALLAERFWQLNEQLEQTNSRLVSLQQQAVQYQALQGSQKDNWQVFDSHGRMYAWLMAKQQATLQSMGVTIAPWSNNNPTEPVVLSINTEAHYDQLMQWLYKQQATSNIHIKRLSLNQAKQAGHVSGNVEISISLNSVAAYAD